jgi:hypothetical protein
MNESQATQREAAQQAAPLRFKVRAQLQVHRRVVTERRDMNGKKTRDVRIETYGDTFGRTTIELPPEEVPLYAQALEPTDEASAAALEALHHVPPAREPEVNHEAARIAETVTATIKALIEAGVLKVSKA